MKKEMENLKKEGIKGSNNGNNKGGTKRPCMLYLSNFPDNVEATIQQMGLNEALTSDVYDEINLLKDNSLEIVCKTGSLKYKICCWMKSNLLIISQHKIGLSNGLMA